MFPLKYRKSVITKEIGEGLKEICLAISEHYEVHFIVSITIMKLTPQPPKKGQNIVDKIRIPSGAGKAISH